MKLRNLTWMINVLFLITFTRYTEEESIGQNDTSTEVIRPISSTSSLNTTTTAARSTLSMSERMKKYLKAAILKIEAMKSGNITGNNTNSNKGIIAPPSKLFREYLRCRQLSSLNELPSAYACPYEFEDDVRVCWTATLNGTMASSVIEYDHGQNNFYDGVRYGIENCTLERFCQSNGSWAMTVAPDLQCKSCVGDGRPVKFNSISIMIETMSLSLSLISLTIAVLCMMNVKRLHLPRNLLHMHLFVAFICRSIVKLVFIHLIVGGYTRSMITYTRDKCGNIEIQSKSSDLFHVLGCRTLSSLFWYTDAVAQTFIFCEAMFLFTALTSHLFRDRGCLPFLLWGWLSPLVWLTMWIASHVITDRLKQRSTCWLEADHTTYFYYFFYIPYAFYLLVNFGIFLYLVRLLYSKYQSKNVQTSRTGNRHLIKSILILIPLFGLHSLFVIWVFYHKNQGHTIWYYISVVFKAIFGDLQGFFTSLIYFYFNTEIRYEVLRQVRRTISRNDSIQRSSAGDTLSTRLSTFRRSISRYRQSSSQTRSDRHRSSAHYPSPTITKPTRDIWWKKCLKFICPCLIKDLIVKENLPDLLQEQQQTIEPNHINETSPAVVPDSTMDDDLPGITSPLVTQIRSSKGAIDVDGQTCDTVLIRNEQNGEEEELLTDENEVTVQLSSSCGNFTSNHAPISIEMDHLRRNRSNTEGYALRNSSANDFVDNQSLR